MTAKINMALTVLAAIGISCGALQAQTPPRSVWTGVYAKAQAARGKNLYFNNCLSCHGDDLQGVEESPGLVGEIFLSHWNGKPVSELYDFINTQMPMGQPGSLGAAGGADVLAFILSCNHFPDGQSELPPDDKVLKGILFSAKP